MKQGSKDIKSCGQTDSLNKDTKRVIYSARHRIIRETNDLLDGRLKKAKSIQDKCMMINTV